MATTRNETKHSLMAERAASARAAHQVLDQPPLIFTDPLALPILGLTREQVAAEARTPALAEGLRRARTAISVRSAFTEERLARDLALGEGEGPSQYVILGAGLDTFAYRRTELADRLTVFEVDQPGTQAWKRQRLRAAGIAEPGNLRFVPVDFNAGEPPLPLSTALAAAGFRRDVPTVFSWLGVIYYLPADSIRRTLAFLGAQDAPATVVLDYAVAEAEVDDQHRHLVRQFLKHNATTTEPWQSWHTQAEIRALLTDCGFPEVEHLDYAGICRRYLDGRPDGLTVGSLVALVAGRKA